MSYMPAGDIDRAREALAASGAALELRQDAEGLTLVGESLTVRGDFRRLLPRLRPASLARELLVRAARVRGVEHPCCVDATAGLGEDALLLAAAGFTVTLIERDPVIAALLADTLRRAREVPQLVEAVDRMRALEGDSVAYLHEEQTTPDVVYLDPMFPARGKSAAVKKKFQLIHQLERPCEDEESLVRAALAARPRKVVIKRPIKGPQLAGIKPSHVVSGKAVRYDCVVLPR